MRLLFAAAVAVAAIAGAAAQGAQSPACALVTAEEAAAILGHPAQMLDGGAPQAGLSGCSWIDSQTYDALSVIVQEGEALAGQDAAAAFDSMKAAMQPLGTFEDLSDLGDKATLMSQTGSDGAITVLLVAAKAKLVTVNGSGVPRDGMIAFGKALAARL